ncbi:late competence protein ComER [Niallia taxi]|uniref:Pyrroline-5-carboxylate reductase n=1 Tax=Niallia taxi TaxID=2499688 RepID=A0A437KDT1_9BACI|nr:late competence protein ComER [Niallia taxi]MCM3215306.1 late competence protein ComER [Niallia taxi]MDK8639607.1 late competence protein ComER [Niallia taxi]MED4037981.1 late competence protein ComER [Niallia taxi]RVT65166.1 late competence protein ComER [Niallia taxi]
MKIGMIGTGNMGKILIEALLESKAISPADLLIQNRTLAKAIQIKEIYPAVTVLKTAKKVAQNADLIFLCVKPHDVFSVASDIAPYLSADKCVVSITSPINTEQLENAVSCSVARIIPSITNRALCGVALFSYGSNCTQEWKQALSTLFNNFSTPTEIADNITRVASDIVSCGPAFFSYLTQRFIDGAVEETEIDADTATKLASEMLIGLGQLLEKGYYTLPTLQEKVSVKGGVTGEGINVLEKNIGDTFNQLFQATQHKFEEDLQLVKNSLVIHKNI